METKELLDSINVKVDNIECIIKEILEKLQK